MYADETLRVNKVSWVGMCMRYTAEGICEVENRVMDQSAWVEITHALEKARPDLVV